MKRIKTFSQEETPVRASIPVLEADPGQGLSKEQVLERQKGQRNDPDGKGYRKGECAYLL